MTYKPKVFLFLKKGVELNVFIFLTLHYRTALPLKVIDWIVAELIVTTLEGKVA
jgi:hypothetical protein